MNEYQSARVNKAILETACKAYYDGRPRIFVSKDDIRDLHPALTDVDIERIYASASDLSEDGYLRIRDFRVSYPADGGEPIVMLGPRPSVSITALGVSYWKSISRGEE
ncbi:MAG: hypothetical protein OXC31_28150 [Spirochaetaceae bacterium]|nr:hypothetical protein [Spirochaetaceae bacterium]